MHSLSAFLLFLFWAEISPATVLVLEAGFWESDRGGFITNLTDYPKAFDSSLDHAYKAVRSAIDNRTVLIHSGKGLEGSTLINRGIWTCPHRTQIDSWETVSGNKGWNWDTLSRYMRAERARDPSIRQQVAGFTFDAGYHRGVGPVYVGPRDTGEPFSSIIKAFIRSL
ncbi:GMC oxidoreductase [Aspergillus carbonarius ITEM 5010]|uniref:glucose oxidase n=1 Tax=Aspergillus carbonarius (strain ITEM 5010) TaxID=602072 RepID=A0A1R3R6L3_ASPC5|nr:GMC oxidoreductase [Aspergillus carbonarius ITEM 5010]